MAKKKSSLVKAGIAVTLALAYMVFGLWMIFQVETVSAKVGIIAIAMVTAAGLAVVWRLRRL